MPLEQPVMKMDFMLMLRKFNAVIIARSRRHTDGPVTRKNNEIVV